MATETAREWIGRREQNATAGFEMPARKPQQCDGIVHMLDDVADEHAVEALAQVGVAGGVDAPEVEAFATIVLAQFGIDLDRHRPGRDLRNAAMLPALLGVERGIVFACADIEHI